MKLLARLLAAFTLILGASPAFAAQLALITGPQDPSQFNATLNSEILLMNAAYGPSGSGNVNTAISIPVVTSPVNLLTITPSATGNPVQIGATGNDTNVSLTVSGQGTGAVLVGGNTTTLAGLQVAQPASRVNDVIVTPGATGTLPSIASGGAGADSNLGLFVFGTGTGQVNIGGSTTTLAGLQVAQTASRVNDVILTPGATGTAPTIVTGGTGADTNVGLTLAGAGTGTVLVGGTTTTLAGLQVAQTASRVNDVLVTPQATGTIPTIASGGAGSDANIGFGINAVGSGAVTFGTGANTVQFNGSGMVAANSNVATAMSSVGPTGSHTTIQEWLAWKDNAGTTRWSPGF